MISLILWSQQPLPITPHLYILIPSPQIEIKTLCKQKDDLLDFEEGSKETDEEGELNRISMKGKNDFNESKSSNTFIEKIMIKDKNKFPAFDTQNVEQTMENFTLIKEINEWNDDDAIKKFIKILQPKEFRVFRQIRQEYLILTWGKVVEKFKEQYKENEFILRNDLKKLC